LNSRYLIAIGLCGIIFFWSIQIPLGPADGVPIYIGILAVLYLFLKSNANTLHRAILLASIILFYTFIQLVMQDINLASLLLTIISVLALSFLIPLINELLLKSKYNAYFYVIRLSRVFLFVQLALMVLQLFIIEMGWMSNNYYHYFLSTYRVSGLFNEPSHLALSLSPFYYLLINQFSWFIKTFKKSSLIILIAIFIICPSSTLIAVFLISIGIRSMTYMSLSPKTVFNFFVSTILFGFLFIFFIRLFPSFSDRAMSIFDYSKGIEISNISNISSLVYLKGYQMAIYGITHFPLGVGLNNMEILNEFSSISHLSTLLFSLNKEDGSSMLFKISSEFGIVGFLFYTGSLIHLLRCVKKDFNYIEQSFLFSFIISGVRGPTYFDGPLLVGISIYVFHLWEKVSIIMKNTIKGYSNYHFPAT